MPIKGRPIRSRNDQDNHVILYSSGDQGRTFDRVRDFGDYGEMYMSLLRAWRTSACFLTLTVRSFRPPLGVQSQWPWRETEDPIRLRFRPRPHPRRLQDARGDVPGQAASLTVQLADGTLVTVASYRGADNKTHLSNT